MKVVDDNPHYRGKANTERLTLALCMIVKNEAHILERCLQSVQELVDQVIVVDTGSTDNTVEVARQCGASVFYFEWCDDFAAARNFSLSRATTDWILVLDADEAIDSKDHADIVELINGPQRNCYQLIQRHYTNEHRINGFIPVCGEYPEWEKGAGGYFESGLVRLIPRSKSVYYQYRIHELLEPSINESMSFRVLETDIRIHHFGHLHKEKKVHEKAPLYRRLGNEKVRESPKDWKNLFELAVELIGHKEFRGSVDAFLDSIELNPVYRDSWVNLGFVLAELGLFAQARRALHAAARIDRDYSETYVNLGVVAMRTRAYSDAVRYFRRAIDLQPKSIVARCNLAETLCVEKRFDEAQQVYLDVIALLPACPKAFEGLGQLSLMRGDLQSSLGWFQRLHETSPDAEIGFYWLGRTYDLMGASNEALSWYDKVCSGSNNELGPLLPAVRGRCHALRGGSLFPKPSH